MLLHWNNARATCMDFAQVLHCSCTGTTLAQHAGFSGIALQQYVFGGTEFLLTLGKAGRGDTMLAAISRGARHARRESLGHVVCNSPRTKPTEQAAGQEAIDASTAQKARASGETPSRVAPEKLKHGRREGGKGERKRKRVGGGGIK